MLKFNNVSYSINSEVRLDSFTFSFKDKGFYYDAIEDSLKVGKYDAWLKFMLTYMKFMCELEDTFLLDIE